VDGLVAPLERVPFDIFDRKYKDSWHMVMQQFRRAVEEIESMTKSFIEQSFQKLRSAEGAFELVQNFKNIQVLSLLITTTCSLCDHTSVYAL
jgi:dynein heavy chain, axonemal